MGRLNRKQQGLVLGLCLFLGVIAMLALTHAAVPEPRCTRAFPRWVGCVVSRHENLAGGLFAATGMIFAAWLVWTGIRDQLEDSRRGRLEAKLQGLRWREQDLVRQLRGLLHSRDYVGRLSRAFEGADRDGASSFMERLLRLERGGDLIPYQGDPAPDGLSMRAQRSYYALLSLRQRAATIHGDDTIGFEADVLRAIAQLRELAGEIDAAIPGYQGEQRQIRAEIERAAVPD